MVVEQLRAEKRKKRSKAIFNVQFSFLFLLIGLIWLPLKVTKWSKRWSTLISSSLKRRTEKEREKSTQDVFDDFSPRESR